MNDPKERKYEPEAPTLLVSDGVSAPPASDGNDRTAQGSATPPESPGVFSEAPTIVDGAAPTLAIAGGSDQFAIGATLPPTSPVRFTRDMGDAPNSTWGGAPLQPGSVFASRYEIIKTLGEGGMGAVYKARDLELEREVALKVIKPELANNPEILQRFKQELILARQVTDRNIIRIFDLGEAGKNQVHHDGVRRRPEPSSILKQRGKLEVVEAVDIMEQVAAGLAAAHREGIIHRDLKPGNIMRDVNGRVVVMDFGLARTIGGDGMTRTGAMLGTIEYMSPEQAQGKELKASSDVLHVGLILYELLAGVTPFHAESAIASLLMRTQQRAVPLVEIDKNIPGVLSNIVAKCLEKDPAKRYQNAEELDADLRAWQGRSGGKKVSASVAAAALEPHPRSFHGALCGYGRSDCGHRSRRLAGSWPEGNRPRIPERMFRFRCWLATFENHTGDPVLDNTLEPMLGLALEGASFINAYGRARRA
jgi:hypothetical protein